MAEASRPKVVLIGQMPPMKGGVTTFMLNLMGSPLNKRFEFLSYTTTRPPKRDVIDNWGYAAVLRGGPRRILLGVWLTVWRLAKFPFFLIHNKVDLVQIQASDYQVFWESVAYCLLAHLVRRPVIFRIGGAFDLFHGGSSPFLKRWIGRSLELPECVVVQSQFSRDYVRSAGRTGEMIVLNNWTGRPVEDIERPPTDHPVCLFIAGTEAIRKGFEEVIRAAQALNAQGSPARFHLVAMVPQLVERVKALGLTNIARIEERIEHRQLLEAMRAADIFLLPSHGEGFPNSLIEAMAAGLPSVVTPVAAVPEIVADGGAIVVNVGDATALGEAVHRLATDPALRERLGREAQAAIRARYTAESVLPPLGDTYERVLAAYRGTR
ncbi:MAG: glycosyltransferase family 4 protein [Proteobacteria bacterium]|nr:glycosyltransferase family 4 protein [Pseudomonadota bacterium]